VSQLQRTRRGLLPHVSCSGSGFQASMTGSIRESTWRSPCPIPTAPTVSTNAPAAPRVQRGRLRLHRRGRPGRTSGTHQSMSTHIIRQAVAARDQARTSDGKFGQQQYARAGGVNLQQASTTPATRPDGAVAPDVKVPASAHISAGVAVREGAHIGERVRLDEGALIDRDAHVREDSVLEEGASDGPEAVIRHIVTLRKRARASSHTIIGPDSVLEERSLVRRGAHIARGTTLSHDVLEPAQVLCRYFAGSGSR